MLNIVGLIALLLESSSAIHESERFAELFCKAALASNLAVCDRIQGLCKLKPSDLDEQHQLGENKIPCTAEFLGFMSRRFLFFSQSAFPEYILRDSTFVTVDGRAPVPISNVIDSYARFLETDLSKLLVPAEVLLDSRRVFSLIELRIFCPSSTWFSNSNLPHGTGTLQDLVARYIDEPILSDSQLLELKRVANQRRLPDNVFQHIGQFVGPSIRSQNLLSDETRFALSFGSRLDPTAQVPVPLVVNLHTIINQLMQSIREECSMAFAEVCMRRVWRILGHPLGLPEHALKAVARKMDDLMQTENIVPRNSLLALYRHVSTRNVAELIGSSRREQLSHHMLTSYFPDQGFITSSVDDAIVRVQPGAQLSILPTLDEITDLIVSLAKPQADVSMTCIMETIVRYTAELAEVGNIPPIYCRENIRRISPSVLFAGIHQLMHRVDLESYILFHRMFRKLPVMELMRAALEQVGYHFERSLSRSPGVSFYDPRMESVYTAFMKACIRMEMTAKQYHIMFGGRRFRVNDGW